MRNTPFLVAAVAFSLLATSPTRATAQIGYLWTFEELLSKADVVVIAECVRTDDTGRRRPHPELTPALAVRELETTFQVSALLKEAESSALEPELHLRHYQYAAEVLERGLVNGGSWLRLEPGHSYLLFLQTARDGFYEPLSGHTFPGDSAYELQKADPTR